MWDARELLSLATGALREQDAALDAEQSVRGLDACHEVDLHPLLADGFARAGVAVLREQVYPGPAGARARGFERERCDLVLLPSGGRRLVDPMAERIAADALRGTLFEGAPLHPEGDVTPEDAYWLEMKCVGQFEFVADVPVPNRSYASSLLRAARTDVRKLARDPAILNGAVLVVLFTVAREVAEHDLQVALHRAVDAGVPVRSAQWESFAIADRIGNGACTLCWIEAGRPAEPEQGGE
ncbi:MAG: hypothetical protein SFY69_11720 [Planctomycetota bacterium]|nr:hypothetical protein [Planctomycetota bacterium]